MTPLRRVCDACQYGSLLPVKAPVDDGIEGPPKEGEEEEEEVGVAGIPGTIRSIFVIDPERKLQLRFTYPVAVGRNFFEVIRCLDSLQITEYHQVATPANWKVGEDVVILPSVTDDSATELFPKGFTSIKPWLRITPQPGV